MTKSAATEDATLGVPQSPVEGGPALDGGPALGGDPALDDAVSTRERILDVALDLFTEKGFDSTSLREIAEKLGVTKAALYYHFASKDDILMALHMRLHEFGKEALTKMTGDQPVTRELWGVLLDKLMSQMLTQRTIFLMHERNQAALEKLHRKEHEAEHDDLQTQFRKVLTDARVPLRDRVRIAASFGVVFAGLFMAGDAFSAVSDEEIGGLLSDVIHDVLDT
ncbi:MAG TPA: TetR/AcrR family transcriptional regulator [Acidimicrobiales bacterium]|nr:TetR/AcrR family transcriptional regulator [Acidimicrobiales bacterium]